MEIITKNAQETENLGRKMGSTLKGGEILLLKGDLGAGKTTFVQGLAKGLGIESAITSPTFILMRSYPIPHGAERVTKTLYHVDLYRLDQNINREIQNLGITDLWGKDSSIFVVEWADRMDITHKNAQKITIENLDNDQRKITIT